MNPNTVTEMRCTTFLSTDLQTNCLQSHIEIIIFILQALNSCLLLYLENKTNPGEMMMYSHVNTACFADSCWPVEKMHKCFFSSQWTGLQSIDLILSVCSHFLSNQFQLTVSLLSHIISKHSYVVTIPNFSINKFHELFLFTE